jgi:hypothetical protein
VLDPNLPLACLSNHQANVQRARQDPPNFLVVRGDRLGHRAGRGPDIFPCSEADEITVVPRPVGHLRPPIAESLADHAPRNSVYTLV